MKTRKPKLNSEVALDLTTMLLASVMSYYAYRIRSTFKNSILWRPLQVFGISPIIFVIGELSHIMSEILYLESPLFEIAHQVLETIFMAVLLYGFYLFYRAWRPPTALEIESKNRTPNPSVGES